MGQTVQIKNSGRQIKKIDGTLRTSTTLLPDNVTLLSFHYHIIIILAKIWLPKVKSILKLVFLRIRSTTIRCLEKESYPKHVYKNF